MKAYRTDQHFACVLEGPPMFLVQESAMLYCGCCCHVGLRLDKMMPATAAVPCSKEHVGLIQHFNLLLKESFTETQDKPLIEVLLPLLDQAQTYA